MNCFGTFFQTDQCSYGPSRILGRKNISKFVVRYLYPNYSILNWQSIYLIFYLGLVAVV